jgi:arylsulfatase A-like enzyme
MFGKWHLGSEARFTPVDRGFDKFFGFLGGGHQNILQPRGKDEYNAPILRNQESVDESRDLNDAFGEEAAAFVERQRVEQKPFFLYLAFNAVNGSVNIPLRGSKCETFEGSIRAPMLMQWPGIVQAGSTYRQAVMTFDLSATALAAAQGDASHVDGKDLRPSVIGRLQGRTRPNSTNSRNATRPGTTRWKRMSRR